MADTQKQRIYPEQRISFAYLPISGRVAARLSATLPAASNAAEQTLADHRLEQALVSRLCARLTGTDFLPLVVSRTALGQPYLTEPFLNVPGRAPGISFSHSRGWLAGVVSEAPQIGIDIERHAPDGTSAVLPIWPSVPVNGAIATSRANRVSTASGPAGSYRRRDAASASAMPPMPGIASTMGR